MASIDENLNRLPFAQDGKIAQLAWAGAHLACARLSKSRRIGWGRRRLEICGICGTAVKI
jgi:hypothetical protein